MCASGVPASTAAATLTATYNNLDEVKALFEANKGQIAGVILEPVVGNGGFIPPSKEFLEGLREITKQEGALLCFDEVMTGFRIAKVRSGSSLVEYRMPMRTQTSNGNMTAWPNSCRKAGQIPRLWSMHVRRADLVYALRGHAWLSVRGVQVWCGVLCCAGLRSGVLRHHPRPDHHG